ncbi:aminotransferase [Jiella sonneratiae]|uniref:Aminotransferase class III-fold pyridoxal phosphate-dependent enzyme n=1 Tax=Jiella sonneratiae TaxID=2816856 RepID=A0ABS3J997_9HYPH|nr:aminotransferase [Jiella sonneratiae]MBO0906239.1 aminotransferase class III-fold pyridoxal phosphate-dependent enzyme [Jiella sonneratiae]
MHISNRDSAASLDAAHQVHPHTNLRAHLALGPTMFVRGSGIHVYDDEGKEYIEGAAALWCASLGFGSERLAEVARKAITEIGYYHNFRGSGTPAAGVLSAKLAAIAPEGMDKVLLQSSGTEANDTAIKLVWYYWHARGEPQRRKIISRRQAYHGTGTLTSCLTAKDNFHQGFGLPFEGFLYVTQPYHYRLAEPGESEEAFSTRLAEEIEALILKEGPETVAAFWAEPVMGSGGVITPPAGYFQKVQAVLDRYGILFVADEVICGFGRTGEMWGSQTYGIRPDLICSAKALSAAVIPISAVIIADRVFEAMLEQSDRFGSFTHGYTYSGHPVACAVASEVLTIYEEMDLVGHVKAIEPTFLQGFAELEDHPLVGASGGVGLIGAVEIVADKASKALHDPRLNVMPRLDAATRGHGLITRLIGNRIALSPPQIITEAETREMFARLRHALDDVAAEL